MLCLGREEMTDGSFEAHVEFAQPAEAVFEALTTLRGLAGWWSPAAGSGVGTGDVLRLDHNGKGTLVLEVDAVEQPRFVGWRVRSYTLNEEWAGTGITFQIGPRAKGGAALAFRHDGLVPELECYERCSRGWEYFLPSLRDYVETGTGRPLA
jgi:uncharacterized protein YndB with AHSA1/START domain